MLYGYARVSTKGQAKDGNSLEAQKTALKAKGVLSENIYADSFTGTKLDRPKLNELLPLLKEGDTLIVTKLDRIARSIIDGSELITDLINRGVRVDILNLGVMDNTPTNKMMRKMLWVFAEFERDMIVERTKEGKAVARQKPGYREGRPKEYTPEQLRHAVELLKTHSYRQVEAMTKISTSTLQRAKKEAELKNVTGEVQQDI